MAKCHFAWLVRLCALFVLSYAAPRNASIAIIGAGFAGLSAVGRLRELAFEDITIFEALNRYGGRVHSIPYGKGRLQQGAQWVNGRHNEIYRIAKALGLIVRQEPDSDVFAEADIYAGNRDLNRTLIDEFYAFALPLEDKYKSMGEKASNWDVGLGPVYARDYQAFLSLRPRSKRELNFFNALSEFFMGFWKGEYGAFQDYAFANFELWNDGEGESVSFALNEIGYQAISDYLKSFVPDDLIKYGHLVKVVNYTGNKVSLTIETDGGTSVYPKQFDYVIVTSSLGHLKKYAKTMLTPALPLKKLEAIDSIGYGNFLKIFLIYDQPWWNYNGSSMATLKVKRSTTSTHMEHFHTFVALDWEDNVSLSLIFENAIFIEILQAWLADQGAIQVDGVPDGLLMELITSHLRPFRTLKFLSPTKSSERIGSAMISSVALILMYQPSQQICQAEAILSWLNPLISRCSLLERRRILACIRPLLEPMKVGSERRREFWSCNQL
ncbi:hypothetical protein L596_028899 [Steinernema carpocapsae]|uniref:Amine oxidase domain-containing protein n=1 Tax=Steinernema carpocapsae TaxID=34508 RepID=A0A4U5LZQ5_STECR|nr:hypothetical protein L596_028899 [Steinernema carpocapsae]